MQPVRFVFGVHNHQPVGNFDHVFRDHVRDAYLPFLRALAERDFLPATLHISGPLLEWLERNDSDYLDLVGRLAADGKLELLLSGLQEPILASLPSRDRVEQITWMREALQSRFGVDATGLWLTERVWEPGLAADLNTAGVEYVLVDDRHFYASGFAPGELHQPFRTESDGKPLTLVPIDERLRYLMPFKPPEDTAAHLRSISAPAARLAVFADDGEKFGGWPGTSDWVFRRGWLGDFIAVIQRHIDDGAVQLVTPSRAIAEVESGGIAYLTSTSYREMETWSLPPHAAQRLHHLSDEIGEDRMRGPEGALIRGGHWRHFLVKYPEANRMHKKMCGLSQLCRDHGNPPDARHEIGLAQCNDAYWHGVFGGLYLPHLRDAVWRHLSRAEAILRRDQPIGHEVRDVDVDGHEEIAIHSARCAALISPRRGGTIEEYTVHDIETNLANVLTRRVEAYHQLEGVAPPVDRCTRALLADRVLAGELDQAEYAAGRYDPLATWESSGFEAAEITAATESVTIVLRPAFDRRLIAKEITFTHDGLVTVNYRWEPDHWPANAWFTTELSVSHVPALDTDPAAAIWTHTFATVAKSERGLEETRQGTSLTVRWPVSCGAATLGVDPYVAQPAPG